MEKTKRKPVFFAHKQRQEQRKGKHKNNDAHNKMAHGLKDFAD